MHRTKAISREVAENLTKCLKEVDEARVEKVIEQIGRARKIFVLGVGHSGLVGKIFAMKLAHLGFSSHFVGEVSAPPLGKEDLLISISQSGQTSTVLTLAKKAKKLGGRVLAITSCSSSHLARISDTTLFVPAREKEVNFPVFSLLGDRKHKNMSGALFGMNIFVLFYGLVCELAARGGQSPGQIDERHANIQ